MDSSQDLERFFLVCSPGTEDLIIHELNEKTHLVSTFFNQSDDHKKFLSPQELVYHTPLLKNIATGGVEIEAPLFWGFLYCRILHLPTRILLRIHEFRAKDFSRLFERLCKVDWRTYAPHGKIDWHISSQGSRLKIKSRIEECAIDAYAKYLNERPGKKNLDLPNTPVYIRVDDDVVTISVDIAGDFLFKRGQKELVNEAPLRENLAASCLLFMHNTLAKKNIATEKYTLLDPMCGSGTFLIEAHNFYQVMGAKSFLWEHFLNCPESLKRNLFKKFSYESKNLYLDYTGFEKDKKTQEVSNKNLEPLIGANKVALEDFFAHKDTLQNALLVCNPPYGKRIKTDIPLHDFYSQFSRQISKLSPKAAGILLPKELALRTPEHYELLDVLEFRHGGILVRFSLYLREN